MTIELMALGGFTVLLVLRRTKKRQILKRPKGVIEIALLIIDAILFIGGISLFLYGAISLALNR